VYAADLDDDQLWEYVVCNDKVFLCFERWGARVWSRRLSTIPF
jgi:hypothetical protein